jgi:uncharacterized protein with HEPN domain
MKDDRVYLQHMLDSARRVRTKLAPVSEPQFVANEDLQIIAVHLLQVIGEAARLVSEPTRQQLSSLPWKQITGMRHKIVHDYLNVDLKIVWETARQDLPPLISALELYLKQSQP